MTIETKSAFTFGHTVTDDNKYIDFNEGSGEITATIAIGSYSLGEFVNAVSSAMNTIGTQEYTVVLDRSTRRLTISAASNFDLLITSGTNATISAYSLMGFNGADVTGSTSHQGDSASGSYYEPQYILQKYLDFEDFERNTNASVNQSASGVVEIVSYGQVKYMECNIAPITDVVPAPNGMTDNPNAKSEYREFIRYLVTKAPIEFVPDVDVPSTFRKCLLESTRESRKGVDYKIKQYKRSFKYFQSGILTFRELE